MFLSQNDNSVVGDDIRVRFECFKTGPAGACFQGEILLSPGDGVNLRVILSSRDRPIDVMGKVVRVDTGDMRGDMRNAAGSGRDFKENAITELKKLNRFGMRRFLNYG